MEWEAYSRVVVNGFEQDIEHDLAIAHEREIAFQNRQRIKALIEAQQSLPIRPLLAVVETEYVAPVKITDRPELEEQQVA